MAETIGRVEFLVSLDGSRLPAEARALGNTVSKEGDRAGKGFAEEFDSAAGPGLSKFARTVADKLSAAGKLGGRKLADDFADVALKRVREKRFDVANALFDQHGFDDLVLRFGSIEGAVDHLRESVVALNQEDLFDDDGTWRGLVITKREMESLNSTIDDFADNLRGRLNPVLDDAAEKNEHLNKATRKLNDSLGQHTSIWKNLSANTRQWSLIIGAVIASMSELAVLGSAAGSGIFVLAGAVSALLPGLGVLIWSMSVLSRDVEDLPESLQAAKAGLTRFGDAWKALGDEVAISVFTEAEGAFDSLADTTKALTPAMKSLGTVVGRVFKNFAASIAPGTEAFQNLSGFIEKSGPIFERVLNIVGKFGAALLVAFNNPNFQRSISEMIGYLERLFDTFDTFLRGPGFDEWLDHGRDVFGAFGKLLDTTGRLLNDMVTDETVARLVTFIDNIDKFLSTGGKGILDFAQQLDIFGLLADALATLGEALEPLAGPMADFAEGLHDAVESGIDKLGPMIEDVAEALAPFVQGIADFMKQNPKAVADALIALGAAFVILKGVGLAKIAGNMALVFASVATGSGVIKAFNVTKLGKIATGIAGIGAIAAATLIPDSFWKQFDIESNLPQSVLTGAGWGAIAGVWGAVIGAGLGVVYSLFTDFERTFNDVGLRITAAFTSGPWGIAATTIVEWFAGLIPEEWATSDNPMERFLSDFATGTEDFGTTLTTVTEDISTLFDGTTEDMGVFETALTIFLDNTKTAFETWKTDVEATWVQTWANLNNPMYWDTIAVLIGTWLGTMYANFVTNTTNIGLTWSTMWTLMNNGSYWGVIESAVSIWIQTIQTTISTKQGEINIAWINFWNSLPGGVSSAQGTVTTAVVNLLNNAKRELTNFALTAGGGWNSFWSGLSGAVEDAYWAIAGWVAKIVAAAQTAASAGSGVSNPSGPARPVSGRNTAIGGIFNGIQVRTIAEAGPEAVVPLNRPLALVRPDVRWLSAIAQGKSMPGGGGGGTPSGAPSRTLTISPGAIQIMGDRAPETTATNVVNRIAQRLS